MNKMLIKYIKEQKKNIKKKLKLNQFNAKVKQQKDNDVKIK